MRRVYGLPLHAVGPMEAARLVCTLPAGSLTWQALDTPAAWTVEQHLLATLCDQMNLWMWANSDPKRRGRRPEPLPRPGQVETARADDADGVRTIRPAALSVDELDAFLAGDFKDT